MSSLMWYIYDFARKAWTDAFANAKTDPEIVEKPERFRDFPKVNKEYCILEIVSFLVFLICNEPAFQRLSYYDVCERYIAYVCNCICPCNSVADMIIVAVNCFCYLDCGVDNFYGAFVVVFNVLGCCYIAGIRDQTVNRYACPCYLQ